MKAILDKNTWMTLIIIVLSTVFLIIGYEVCKLQPLDTTEGMTEEHYNVKVTEIGDIVLDEFSLDDGATTITNKEIFFAAQITHGERKGDTIYAVQHINYLYPTQPAQVDVGQKIIVTNMIDPVTGEDMWQYVERNRSDLLMVLCAVFLLLIIIIGRKKGVATILSLLFTVGAIFLVYIPAILNGYQIYLVTAIVSLYIILMSLLMINGANKKTLAAILGNMGGVVVAGVLGFVMNHMLNITGIVEEESIYLMDLGVNGPIDLRAVVWGSIVIGSLGAIMDVAMSIASAMNELAQTMEHRTFQVMLKSGMNIGKDAIGTMTNTLILAYIGGSLATVLLLVAYNRNVLYLFNMEMIVVDVVKAVVGSMGILFAVPVTAVFSAYIFTQEKKSKSEK